jgi:DNA helicase-2/ATP-dependent DNA helicase PcrA
MIQNIAAVFESISRYQEAGRDRFALRFVDNIESLLTNIVPPSVDVAPDIDAVRILTVHAAKGLEWPVVFLPSLISDRFPARPRHEGLELPEELIGETLPTGNAHLEEERRLAYVAMTRAKDQLILSGAAAVGEGIRPKKPSPFVFEALKLTNVDTPIERVAPTARVHHFAPIEPAPKTIRFPEYDGVLFLSPAMIEAYQQDPYTFYWRYVLKAPQPPSRHLNYGNAIHAAIEAYYQLRQKTEDRRQPPLKRGPAETEKTENTEVLLDGVLKRYKEAWRAEGFDSAADEQRQFERGETTLKRFVDRVAKQPLPSGVEEEFVLLLPGVRIRGRMDAVFRGQGEIRDFKTSQVETQKQADQKVRDNLPIRIYALAYAKRYGELPQKMTLDFVEADLEASLEPSEDMLKNTERVIAETAAGIRAGQFDANPNFAFKDYE